MLFAFIRFISVSLFFLMNFYAVESTAQGTKTKWGLEAQKLQNRGDNDAGFTLGVRHSMYLGDALKNNLYVGYNLNVGSAKGGRINDDNITYGGLLLGADGASMQTVTYDLSTMVGYAYGSAASRELTGHSIALQPTLSVGLMLREGYRASFAAGYLYMPSAPEFSTLTFGIRIERKSVASPQGSLD